MQKAKKYDWKDSNMALFGTETDREVKKAAAETEPAWQGAGKDVGLQIWRIEKFEVAHWNKEQYGEFYNGDSYIILNTYQEDDSDALLYDVHFWIGKYSTQDEYGTAAYKTVELDTLLDDKPIQHREVAGHESALFKSYFDTITLLKGGSDTGFNRVVPEVYKPRLFHVYKETVGNRLKCVEVSAKKANLNSGDVYIIDNGNMLYQWNGQNCSGNEKYVAGQMMDKIISNRGGKPKKEIIEENSTSNGHPAIMVLPDGKSKSKKKPVVAKKKMLRVSDADGSLDLEDVEGYSRGLLTSDDVYIVITETHCYLWVGKKASIDERKKGMSYATNYLHTTETPFLPISVIVEGKEPAEFENGFGSNIGDVGAPQTPAPVEAPTASDE